MSQLHQRTVVQVEAFFNIRKKQGWETKFSYEVMLYNPTKEQILYHLKEANERLLVETLYHFRGERDRIVICRALYPIVHENSTLGYWGDMIAERKKDDRMTKKFDWYEDGVATEVEV